MGREVSISIRRRNCLLRYSLADVSYLTLLNLVSVVRPPNPIFRSEGLFHSSLRLELNFWVNIFENPFLCNFFLWQKQAVYGWRPPNF